MRVLTITTPDVENGLGNRVTIWFAGCSHRCVGCHNQHTWDYNQGTPLFDEGVIEKIFSEVDKDYIAGITLAGGDPFSQNDESLNELLKFVRMYKSAFPEKNIWEVFEDMSDITEDDYNITVAPYVMAQFYNGEVHFMTQILISELMDTNFGSAFKFNMGYKTQF